jgi:hypothetical protein
MKSAQRIGRARLLPSFLSDLQSLVRKRNAARGASAQIAACGFAPFFNREGAKPQAAFGGA